MVSPMSLLVLSRKLGEQVQIGEDITITVVRITNQGVRIGIEAPKDSLIARAELIDPAVHEAKDKG